ncbi:MAG TPA: N-acetyl sugar amidotransferase [Elusimicrobiota bacterium]|nr:N-acetyl sugar amidotransferase [Elusimicrobiota bacterium]
MNYCRQCVLPDTRPGLTLDAEGVCNACRTHATRRSIDWAARGRAFAEVARSARERAAGYDCLIPVSGGKDSTWQVLQCLEQGLRVLAVTWKTPARTDIGRANLDNLIRLGVDHIDYQIHPEVERRFMRRAFERCGTTGLPMHMALFAIPLTLAVRFKIPLVVWGENSAFEYGGPAEERTGFALDAAWLKRYGVTHGTTAADWVGPDLTAKDLVPYRGPTDAEMAAAGVRAVFLGYYFSWDPIETYRAAAAHGFRSRLEGPKTGHYDFADIDDDFIAVHHHLKWHKFGFTRLFDNLSLEIRNGRLTREAAVRAIAERGDQTPHADIDKFCSHVGMTRREFEATADRFRNPALWSRDNGFWKMKDFLIKTWRWNEHCPT